MLRVNDIQPDPLEVQRLLSRRALARNTLLNLTGQVLPLVVGFVAIPLTVHGFGTDRFGLLTLAWAVIGYFSLFDLGLGRAITQLVAVRLGRRDEHEIPRLVWTGLAVMAFLGVIGAVVSCAISPWLARSVLRMPDFLREEAMWAFIALGASIPIVILSAGLGGVLIAMQRFDVLNALRIPVGVSTFLVPVAVMPFSTSLFDVCVALVLLRVTFLSFYLLACFKAFPALRLDIAIERAQIGRLLSFGGWMTVTNVLGPLMVYLDRFIIGASLSTAAMAYYATPYEIVTKLWIVPVAVVSSLFPAFATAKSGNLSRASELFSTGTRFILVVLAPIVLAIVTFAREGLGIWLGAQFGQHSTLVLQWLAVGVFLNSLGHSPFALIQGFGRPDLTAKLHIIELPLYVLSLIWLLRHFGINGVAIAWVIRVGVDTALLLLFAHRLLPVLAKPIMQSLPLVLFPLPLFLVGAVLNGLAVKAGFYCIATLSMGFVFYFFACSPAERQSLRTFLWSLFETSESR